MRGGERITERTEGQKPKFVAKLEARWQKGNFVSVSLDTGIEERRFVNGLIIEATHNLVCAYILSIAPYEAYGERGLRALRGNILSVKRRYAEIPVILHTNKADIENTNRRYAQAFFDELGADAITVNPYLGGEALQPFFERKDKGIFVVCRTSNPGAREIQDLLVDVTDGLDVLLEGPAGLTVVLNMPPESEARRSGRIVMPLYEVIAHRVANHWNVNGNCGLIVDTTSPEELERIRRIVGNMPIFIQDMKTQSEEEAMVKAGQDSRGWGMIVNFSAERIFSSSGSGFSDGARQEIQRLHEAINRHRLTG